MPDLINKILCALGVHSLYLVRKLPASKEYKCVYCHRKYAVDGRGHRTEVS